VLIKKLAGIRIVIILAFLVAPVPAKPEEKPKPASPAKVTPVVAPVEVPAAEASNVEETKHPEPVVMVKAGRGRPKKGALKETAVPVAPKEVAPVAAVVEPGPAASTTAARRPGRPKKNSASEPGNTFFIFYKIMYGSQ
jgi:hypothetical protein